MGPRKKANVPARGRLVDDLLVATVICVALVVCAYIYLPDFERGVQGLVREISNAISMSYR